MAPNNTLTCWGNEKTMNLNPLILTNIQSSPYFKVNLYELKTYHEVIDEIYYKVTHLEPWEKGSRKTAGQTGMCGGVRGVGAGGIVSSAYCLLYKLFTLKLTRKQLVGLLEHADSPYIRGLGFMYIRYTQDPKELWDWFEPYFEDEEEIDVKAGGGHIMLIGEMIKQWLTKLEWYCTLFPRIPVPVAKDIDQKMRALIASKVQEPAPAPVNKDPEHIKDEDLNFGEAEKYASSARRRSPTPPYRNKQRSPPVRRPSPHRRSPPRHRSPPRRRSPPRHRSPPWRGPARHPPPRYRRSPPRYRGRSRSPRQRSPGFGDFAAELQKEKERQQREKDGVSEERQRSRSHDRHSKDRHRSRSRDRVKPSKHRSRSRDRYRSQSQDRPRSSKHRSRSRSKERRKHKKHSHSKDR